MFYEQFWQIIEGKEPSLTMEVLTSRHEEAIGWIIKHTPSMYGLTKFRYFYGSLGSIEKVEVSFWVEKDTWETKNLYDRENRIHPIFLIPTEKEWKALLESFDLFRFYSNPPQQKSFLSAVFKREYETARYLLKYFQEDGEKRWPSLMEVINKVYIYFKGPDVTVVRGCDKNVHPFVLVLKGNQTETVNKAMYFNSDWFGAPGYSYNWTVLDTLEKVHFSPQNLWAMLPKKEEAPIDKIRRRVEDTLRNSDPDTILRIAKELGVKTEA